MPETRRELWVDISFPGYREQRQLFSWQHLLALGLVVTMEIWKKFQHNTSLDTLKQVLLYEPRHEKTGFLYMRKQRRRSASRS